MLLEGIGTMAGNVETDTIHAAMIIFGDYLLRNSWQAFKMTDVTYSPIFVRP